MLDQGLVTGLLTEEFAAFFAENLSRIEQAFSTDQWSDTRAALKKLEDARQGALRMTATSPGKAGRR